MTEPQFMLNNLEIINSSLRIDAVALFNSADITPKARVVFKRGRDIRRMPLLLRNSFRKTGSDLSFAIYSFTYNLDFTFNKKEALEDTEITFEIDSGKNVFSDIQYKLSKNFRDRFPGNSFVNARLAGSEFDGALYYSSEKPRPDYNGEFLYSVITKDDGFYISKAINPDFNKNSVFHSLYNALQITVSLLFSIILLPFMIIDGILAALSLVPRRKAPIAENFIGNVSGQIKANIANFIKGSIKDKTAAMKIIQFRDEHYRRYYKRLSKKPVIQNQIAFISGRRDELGGNEKYVYDLIKDRKDIEFRFLFSTQLDRFTKSSKKKEFYKLYATSKVVIVDDYYNLLNTVEKRKEVKLFQLWHACGAFKTFGFSRLGKPDSPKQSSPNHRMYDYATVSSESIAKYYAEGFGISDSNILPTGIPRTDIFFNDEYADNFKNGFYEKYPQLKNKKIILFAPTFRGAGQKSAYYPISAFNPNSFAKNIDDDYCILIKLHPFCLERYEIDEKYKDRIIDFTDEDELNDLLFVTDLLVTDYSSCVFEASLLNIPMVFYAFDLYQYISDRDFYSDFISFVPGKIVFTQSELEKAIDAEDFENEKVEPFKEKYFSKADGKASQRVADAIINALKS